MSASASGKLYTPRLLALAVSLADYPLTEDLPFRAEARSRTCGSTLALGLALDGTRRITRIGLSATACAVGQASAAIFASHACAFDAKAAKAMRDAMAEWLSGDGSPPDWPDIDALADARDYPSRHGAIMLPWKAACDALCKPATAG